MRTTPPRRARPLQPVRLAHLARLWGTPVTDIRRACRGAGIRIVHVRTPDGIASPALEPDGVEQVRRLLDVGGERPTGPTRPLPDVRRLPTIPADSCWGPGDALDGSRRPVATDPDER